MCDRVPNQFLSIPNRTDFKLFKVTDVERQNMKELKKQINKNETSFKFHVLYQRQNMKNTEGATQI